MKRDNRIIVDINKCQWARFFYRNQYGQTSNIKPHWHTVRNEIFTVNELALHHPLYAGETMLERAKRLKLVDRWVPEIIFKLTAHECITYTGQKAVDMDKAWKAKIFKKKGKKE